MLTPATRKFVRHEICKFWISPSSLTAAWALRSEAPWRQLDLTGVCWFPLQVLVLTTTPFYSSIIIVADIIRVLAIKNRKGPNLELPLHFT